ncbi:hypothetical protein H6504_03415 [Candidatus Woesearchaeota archaeon]|nr:hypothetical protein [Candidatus Woesearchaeota archaeon]
MHKVRQVKEKLEEFDAALALIPPTMPAVVEGKNDAIALQELGLNNPLILIDRRPLYKVVEGISTGPVMILTDLDHEGKKMYRYLYHHLTRHGIIIDKGFRDFLWKKTTLRQIEDLSSYYRNLKLKIHETRFG